MARERMTSERRWRNATRDGGDAAQGGRQHNIGGGRRPGGWEEGGKLEFVLDPRDEIDLHGSQTLEGM